MRKCSLCPTPDRPSVIEEATCTCPGGDVEGHTDDCRKLEHTVRLQIIIRDTAPTKKQLAQGWQERPHGFRGKPAIFRYVCRACINKMEQTKEIEQFKKDNAGEDDDEPPTMYQILCD